MPQHKTAYCQRANIPCIQAVLTGDEFNAGIHQRGDEIQIAGEPIELGHQEGRFAFPRSVQRDRRSDGALMASAPELAQRLAHWQPEA
jgi:hypothetical protein